MSTHQNKNGRPTSSWLIGWRTAVSAVLGAGVVVALCVGSAHAGPPNAGMPAEKAARQQAELNAVKRPDASRKVAAAQARAAAPAVAAPPADAGLTPGIVDQRQGPFSAAEFAVGNMYRAHVGSRWLFVFAGATKAPDGQAQQSAVRVYQMASDGTYSFVGQFVSPVQGGVLSVSAAAATTLSLTSDTGQSVSFDLSALTFG